MKSTRKTQSRQVVLTSTRYERSTGVPNPRYSMAISRSPERLSSVITSGINSGM